MSLNNTHFQDTMIAAVMTGTGIVTATSNLNQVDAIINEENENLNEAELEIQKWVHMNHLFLTQHQALSSSACVFEFLSLPTYTCMSIYVK